MKKDLDTRFPGTWHVVVGKNFGSFVTHEVRKCVPGARFVRVGRATYSLLSACCLLVGTALSISSSGRSGFSYSSTARTASRSRGKYLFFFVYFANGLVDGWRRVAAGSRAAVLLPDVSSLRVAVTSRKPHRKCRGERWAL